ncbi:TPA: hypothetical protein NGI80_000186 [Legionella pneumophila]|nr:hypothetical protein [Legionella pneumophila]
MERKYYVVISNENEDGDHEVGRFSDWNRADSAAKSRKGKLYEFKGKQLVLGEDYKLRGKLIKDYT